MMKKHSYIFNHQQRVLETIPTGKVAGQRMAAPQRGVERKNAKRPPYRQRRSAVAVACVVSRGDLVERC